MVMQPPIDVERFSNWNRLIRSTCYVRRMLKPCKGSLSPQEIKYATCWMVRIQQMVDFPDDYRRLSEGNTLCGSSKLLALTPFYDGQCIRVGGRLRNSRDPDICKHPLLLSSSSHMASIIIRDAHIRSGHGGIQATMSYIRQTFWVTNCYSNVRRAIRSCVKCARFAKLTPPQLMGDLPEERVTPSRPFTTCGVDYAGPFSVKFGYRKQSKSYLAVFVCFATKAVHFELVTSLTTEGFLAALKRFVSRRGLPHTLYSDNGTNFVGARNEMAAVQDVLHTSNGRIEDFSTTQGFKWCLIPPRAPHFGGLWEAAVKSAKRHLRRIIGTTLLSHEELETIVIQVEAMLKSRRLTSISSDANDYPALTPGRFLIGSPLNAWNEAPNTGNVTSNQRRKLVQRLE